MFGWSFEKFVMIAVVAFFIVGPTRMPTYAASAARVVKRLRAMADGAKDRLRDEMGSEFDDVDWKRLDPRQYDPRNIIRSALTESDENQGSRITWADDTEETVLPIAATPSPSSAPPSGTP